MSEVERGGGVGCAPLIDSRRRWARPRPHSRRSERASACAWRRATRSGCGRAGGAAGGAAEDSSARPGARASRWRAASALRDPRVERDWRESSRCRRSRCGGAAEYEADGGGAVVEGGTLQCRSELDSAASRSRRSRLAVLRQRRMRRQWVSGRIRVHSCRVRL